MVLGIENQETCFRIAIVPAKIGTKASAEQLLQEVLGKFFGNDNIGIQPYHVALTGLKSIQLCIDFV